MVPPDRYAVIDTETTGLDPVHDAVVSLAVVPVDGLVVRTDLARQILVDPGRPIPPHASAVHGLGDADVAGAGDLAGALADLGPLLTDRIVVGHNLGFDLAFLAPAGFDPPQTIDTLAASRLLWRRREHRHTLDAVGARVDVAPTDRHTAIGDATATAFTLVALLPLLAERDLASPDAIADAYTEQRERRAARRRSRLRGRLRRSSPRRSSPRRRRTGPGRHGR